MKIKIRRATKKDIPQIIKLQCKLFDYHVKIDKYYKSSVDIRKGAKKHLLDIINKRSIKIIVAEENNKIIGYFIGKITRSKPYAQPKKIGKMSTAFIDEKYRRNNIGHEIFNEYLKWFRQNNIKNIELNVDHRNKLGRGVWQKFGFKKFMEKRRLDL